MIKHTSKRMYISHSSSSWEVYVFYVEFHMTKRKTQQSQITDLLASPIVYESTFLDHRIHNPGIVQKFKYHYSISQIQCKYRNAKFTFIFLTCRLQFLFLMSSVLVTAKIFLEVHVEK